MATPRQMAPVPLLPGYSIGRDVTKVNHPKGQTLAFRMDAATDTLRSKDLAGGKPQKLDLDSIQVMKDPRHRYEDRATLTHDEREAQKSAMKNTYRPTLEPDWLRHDRKVLRYFAYFQEPVHESPSENFRIRQCTILYHLEDGTIHILERRTENSGIPQGAFLKRHRIPKPDGSSGSHYSPEDLRCGAEVSFYAKVFKIFDMDEFTRAHYEDAGLDPGDACELPTDNFFAAALGNGSPTAAGCSLSPLSPTMSPGQTRDTVEGREFVELSFGGNRKNAKLHQFMDNDRRVLRFCALWDDPTRYGSRQYFTVHYFLADDTVEILECLARNTGREPYPVFTKRAPLRKNPWVSPTPGMLEPEPDIYKPVDLVVGEHINVFGRQIFLYDCDAFTRDFYRQFCSLEQKAFSIEDPPPVHVVLASPPHTGIGSEEDSLASCLALRQKPPRKNFKKLMGYSDKVLRFEAQMENGREEDANRKFIVAVYMADETIAIWEFRTRNSGHCEGKFAERSKKRTREGAWLTAKDFKVGRTVTINAMPFILLKADEATEKLMELHAEELRDE